MSVSGGPTSGTRAPAYAVNPKNLYDTGLCRYNWKPTNTYRHRAGLARAIAGQLCEEVFVGDSATDGAVNLTGPVFDRAHAWPVIYRNALSVRGIPVNGSGMIRSSNNLTTFRDSRCTPAGSWITAANSMVASAINATLTFANDQAGTSVCVPYLGVASGGTFTVAVDGAVSGVGFATVDTSLTVGVQQIVLPGLTNALHSVVVKCTVLGVGVVIYGEYPFTPGGGWIGHNVAQDGGTAAGAGNQCWSDVSSLNNCGPVWSAANQYQSVPTTVHCALGGNDENAANTPDQMAAGITVIRGLYPNSDFVLHLEVQAGENSPATHAAWCTRAYALADTLDVPLIDWQDFFGSWANLVALGLNGDAIAHPNRAGYAMIGNLAGAACIV